MKNEQAKNIRWGIIGLGGIAQKFATDLAVVPNCKLIAVASRDQQKANEFAKKFNVEIAFGSYEDLSQYNDIDAVYIATPHSFHKEHSILCLKHKKAVLCEKPFAMNANEVDEMIITAKENNVLLMEALWTYFLPHYNHVLDLIKSKKYGEIKKLEADFGFHTPYNTESRVFQKEVGGGSLLDIGIYPIFAALSTLGNPDSIAAKATFFENGADSSCEMIFQYENSTATLKSTLLEVTPTEAIFTCEKAIIKINTRFHEPSSVSIIQDNEEEILDFPCDTLGYNFEIAHFNQLLRDNKKESDVMTFDFSINLINTLDMVRNHINLNY
jgi:predicted dehydrogenase